MEQLQAQVLELTAAVGRLNTSLGNQQTQLNNLTQVVRFNQASQSTPASTEQRVIEPKMPLPERFSGSRSDFRNFRSRCLTYFEVRPVSSGTESQRISLIKTLLQGDSQTWAYELPPGHTALSSVKEFFEAMAVVYDDPDIAATAIRKLRALRQGRNSAEVYAAEFRRWASISRWENQALTDQFILGLTDRVSEMMLAHPEPRSLEDAMSLAIKVDRRLRYHQLSRSHAAPLVYSSDLPCHLESEEPMQLGRVKLSKEEKQRRRQKGLCLYCAEQGHVISRCPNKSGNGSA